MKNRFAVAGLCAGLAGGIGIGLGLGISGIAGASSATQTAPTTVAPGANTAPLPGSGRPGGSNENAAHETGESPARESAEASGQFGGHHPGGGSNEDPTHESSESPTREGTENAKPTIPAAPGATTVPPITAPPAPGA